MWMASLARVTVPQELAAYVGRGLDGAAATGAAGNQALGGQSIPAAMAPVAFSPGLAQGRADRWSADAWMLARQEKAGIPASGLPRYGGSQAGAVLRYHLAPQSGHQPVAYLRATSALGSISENEAALGVAARPFARLPLMVGMEGRAYRANRQTSFRPAALAYTQLPPFDLPFGMTGDAYLRGICVQTGRWPGLQGPNCGWAGASGAGRRGGPNRWISDRERLRLSILPECHRACRWTIVSVSWVMRNPAPDLP